MTMTSEDNIRDAEKSHEQILPELSSWRLKVHGLGFEV